MLGFICKIVDDIEEFFLDIFEKFGFKKIVKFYRDHKEGMRYLIFGGFTTIVNILIFSFCERIINFSTTISNVIAWVIAVIFAYMTNKLFVFISKTENVKKLVIELISFMSARIFTLIVETIYLNITIDIMGFNSIFMKIISNIIVVLLNFILSKLFIFNQK